MKKLGRKVMPFILICLMLLLSTSVNGLLDSITTQSSKDIVPNTLLVVSNRGVVFTKGNPISMNARVFNSTGLLLNGTYTDCILHLYNSSNFPIIESFMAETENGFNFTINSSVTSMKGTHSYDIWCNTTNSIGGVFSSEFEITESGIVSNNNHSLPITLILISAFSFFFILAGIIKIEAIKYLLIAISTFILILMINIAILLGKDNLPDSVSNLLSTTYLLILYPLEFIMGLGIIFLILYHVVKWLPDKFKMRKSEK